MAVDSSGDIFIAEGGIGTGTGLAIGDYKIWKINGAGIVSTAAGNGIENYSGDGGPATAAQLNMPANMVLDSVGNLYIADSANNRVRKVSPGGSDRHSGRQRRGRLFRRRRIRYQRHAQQSGRAGGG